MKNFNRLRFLRAAVCLAFVAGILFSFELWFPVNRTFPRAPIFDAPPENVVSHFERFLAITLAVSLLSLALVRRRKPFFIAVVCSAVPLIFLDQTRLQPWTYQYLLLLVVFALLDWRAKNETTANQTLGLLQIIIAALYFWSGAQKLNFSFSAETLPFLLAPVQNVFPNVRLPLVFIGFGVALVEIFIGCGLLVRKTKNLALAAAILTHAVVLGLLIAKDFNGIVWIWNAALVVIIAAAFWRSDASIKQTFANLRTDDWTAKTAKSIAAASVLLPALSFFGLWDLYLSGALYSGNTATAVVRIDGNLLENLPETARRVVFQTKNGERILPFFEWAMADLSVPVYPESRVFKRAARRVCDLATDKNAVELIVKESPAIFDGNYKVTRISCAELE